MSKKKDIEHYQRQEKLEEYKLLPLAFFALFFMGVGFYLSDKEVIEVGEVKLYGLAKYVWALSVEVFYCLGILFGVSSLVFIIWLGLMAREAKFRLHPWKPLASSTVLLIICFLLFFAGKNLESYVLANVREINEFIDIEEYKSYSFFFSFLWFLIASWFAMLWAGILFELLRVPFNVKQHIESWHEIG